MGYVLLIRCPSSIIVSITLSNILVGMIILISLLGHSPLGQGQDDDDNNNDIITDMTNIPMEGTMETFDIRGYIAGLIYAEDRPMAPEILSGTWDLKVIRGKVNYFAADFEQVAFNGSIIHKYNTTNFTEDNINLSDIANKFYITGITDVIFDNTPVKNVGLDIEIHKLKAILMRLYIRDHLNELNLTPAQEPFRGKQITGVVDSSSFDKM
jgi:hypothetical protein